MPSPSGQQTFAEVLTAAVADMSTHGFDSAERLERWTSLLRQAAERETTSPERLTILLQEGLRSIYHRLVENGGVLGRHPGVPRWTFEKLKPKLRDELSKRILMSANLIRMNRAEAISDTLRRFQGWGSSIPAGGSKAVDKNETKAAIKKSLSSLPYDVRRVIVDQGHKFTASLNEVVAHDGGAIAGRWRSHKFQRGYDGRPEHNERDGKVYAIRGNWALAKGLMNKGAGYTDEMTKPGEEVFCFPGDSRVPFADGVEVAYRRWYSGDLAEVVTSSGKTIRATLNHPILTPNGWAAIGTLKEGDDIIEVAEKSIDGVVPKAEYDDAVPSISQIFSAACEFGGISKVRGGREQFHGDGSESDVDVIMSAGALRVDFVTALSERCGYLDFTMPKHGLSLVRALHLGLYGLLSSANGVVRRCGQALSTVWAFPRHAYDVGLGAGSYREPHPAQARDDRAAGRAEALGESENTFVGIIRGAYRGIVQRLSENGLHFRANLEAESVEPGEERVGFPAEELGDNLDALPFRTQTAHVVEVKRTSFSGHVYNLQTRDGWYVTEGILAHNCRCSYVYIYSLRELPPDMLTAKGKGELQRVRLVA